jgi:plasmid stabilization system protein ParE
LSQRLAVRVVLRAAREVDQASEWWRQNRPAAPDAIREEIERAFDLISLQPKVGARSKNTALQGIRRLHLARIHYDLYYRVTSSAVEVLAFWHSNRGSGPRL